MTALDSPLAAGMVLPMLVVGGDGTLGRALVKAASSLNNPVWWTTRRVRDVGSTCFQFDFAQPIDQWGLPPQQFATVVLAAGVTSIQACESNPDQTRHVNVLQQLVLAKELLKQGAFVACLSSSTVFDGETAFAKPMDPTRPMCEYGRQKQDLEQGLLGLGGGVAIIRLSKVIAANNPLFTGWRRDLLAQHSIHPFSNMVVSPVSLDFAVRVVMHIARSRLAGVHHISAANDMSYADLARHMAIALQVPYALVRPVLATGNTAGFYPRYAALNCDGLAGMGFVPPRASSAVEQFRVDSTLH